MSAEPLLAVRGLTTEFPTRRGPVRAVDGVDLDIGAGECVGIVGESGSGKSITFLSVLGLVRPPGEVIGGSITFEGRELTTLPRRERQALRGSAIALAMQDALAALNPAFTVGTQIVETLLAHRRATSAAAARAEAISLMTRVGIPSPESRLDHYPHQFSGGMRQRIMIAIALACRPRLLIADEPTTALDVTVRAQVLDLIDSLRAERGMSVALITHDIGVVAERTSRLFVMYAGQVVEAGPTGEVVAAPRHPYTRGLIASLPRLTDHGAPIRPIPGQPPDPVRLPKGCRFAPRCGFRVEGCEAPQALRELSPGHSVRCHRADELAS